MKSILMGNRLKMMTAALLAPLAALPASGETKQQPNIVFILSDDQRMDELGFTGHPHMKTPNIDRLAREGAFFDNSFATSPSCLPNRTSLLTGQWERRHTLGWSSISALSREQWAKTFPMVFKQNGYFTAYVGKNHTPGLRYWDFDYYYGNRQGHLTFYPKTTKAIFKNAAADTQPEILGEGAANFLEPDRRFVESAGDLADVFLRERPKDKPFLLYVNFNVPHTVGTLSMKQRPEDDELYRTAYRDVQEKMPLPPGYIAKADVKEPKIPLYHKSREYTYIITPEKVREQGVLICQTMTGIDRVVGQIQEQLQRLGQADNTIIVYSSDNGHLHGEHGYGGKCLLYDPSIRVPLIIYDPRLPADERSRRVEELVVSQDVAPTLLQLCGIAVPDTMQGRSLVPLLRGEKVDWRPDFFAESLILLGDYPLIQGVRNAEWKYIRYWPNPLKSKSMPSDYRKLLNLGLAGEEPAYEELFHLTADPLEQRNLVADPEHAAQLAAMRVRCTELLRETRGDPQFIPAMPAGDWLKEEVPDGWKELTPLMSKQ
jgi:arylsulfatase A-like enzyme